MPENGSNDHFFDWAKEHFLVLNRFKASSFKIWSPGQCRIGKNYQISKLGEIKKKRKHLTPEKMGEMSTFSDWVK